MLVIMALVTTFMTSPLLEWIYPKQLIRLDEVEPEAVVAIQPTYRILVPVANPKTQQGLLNLAVRIAGNRQPAVVTLLSLVELQEDYAFASTPVEADRLIEQRRLRLQELIETLNLGGICENIGTIVRVSGDVARETTEIADLEQTNLILVGWHRPVFDNNRLGGRVGKILNAARTDVAVFIDRGISKLETILVLAGTSLHDDLALELGLRLLLNSETCRLNILRVASLGEQVGEFSREFALVMDRLGDSVRERIDTTVVEASEALASVVGYSRSADLTIAGASRAWALERQTLGEYTDALAINCHSPLLITRKYSQLTSPHITSLLSSETKGF
jgi:nucleotide-binding universal stress UspA family protein